jgi:hypothetical protein
MIHATRVVHKNDDLCYYCSSKPSIEFLQIPEERFRLPLHL